MKNMSGKIVTWLNDALRDYVYGPRRWFNPLRIVFVVMVAFAPPSWETRSRSICHPPRLELAHLRTGTCIGTCSR